MKTARIWWNHSVVCQANRTVAADIILPLGDGPFPVVFIRTPYGRGTQIENAIPWHYLVECGYALVVVDMRGRGDSTGSWMHFVHDADDAFCLIYWITSQPWSTGKVGMVGASNEGLSQWWSVKKKHHALRCIVPQAIGVACSFGGMGNHGIPVLYWLWWFHLVNGRTVQYPGAVSWGANISHLPFKVLDQHLGLESSAWQQYVAGKIDWVLLTMPCLMKNLLLSTSRF